MKLMSSQSTRSKSDLNITRCGFAFKREASTKEKKKIERYLSFVLFKMKASLFSAVLVLLQVSVIISAFYGFLLPVYASPEIEEATVSKSETLHNPSVSAKCAALYEPETNTYLYLKNGAEKRGMASTTKIMTALIAAEKCADITKKVKIDERACGIEGSSVYLKAGEVLSMEELLYALLLRSANDAAAAIAYEVAGGIEEFAEMMNRRAEEMGLEDTHFSNPHGLDDKEHYTTAKDLAIIASEVLKNEYLKNIVSTVKKAIPSPESDHGRVLINHNRLLRSYDGAIGLKTGYTKKCGRCLVGAAEKEGLTLISVTLDAPDDWNDHREMLDYGFSLIEKRTFISTEKYTFEIPVIGGKEEKVTVSPDSDLSIIVKRGLEDPKIHLKVCRYTTAPVRCGDILGEVILEWRGKDSVRIPLKAQEDVPTTSEKKGFFDFFKRIWDGDR